jgi:ABC-type multidrug transport system fused ATPase/permease subunit
MAVFSAGKHVLAWFKPYWLRRWRGISLVILLTILSIAMSTAYPLLFKYVIDSIIAGEATSTSQKFIWMILGVGIARTFTRWLLPSTRYVMNLTLGKDIKLFHFDSVLKKKPTFFNKFRSGDLITRFSDDIDGDLKLSWFANSGIMRPIEAGFTLLFSIAVMMTLHWKLTLIAVSPLPLIIWIMSKTESIQHKAYLQRQESTSQTNNILESAFSSLRIVIGYAMESAQGNLFKSNIEDRKSAEERVVFVRSLLESVGSLVNQIGLVIILFLGGFYVVNNIISMGDFYAFIAYMSGITEPIWTISWFFVSINVAKVSVNRLEEIEQGENRDVKTSTIDSEVESLETKNLTYKFPDEDDDVIRDISFSVRRGEKIGIVGEVGSGKTILLQLISGWLTPDSGSVNINNHSLHTLNDESKASIIGYVPQEIQLFSGSLIENIHMGRLTDFEIDDIKKASVIGDELSNDKIVEQGGIGLSGGQRARAAIARAIYAKPPILILDDVTSALDLNTEKQFWKALKRFNPEAMYLVATHREATAEVMDRVIWIEKGEIYKVGTHHDLIKEYEFYRDLFAKE